VAVLHFVYGLPGSGKTSLARAIAARMPAIAVCEDEWLAALVTEPIASLAEYIAWSRRIRAIIAPLATRLLQLGTSVAFDFAGNTPAHRAWVRAIADAAGAEHRLHILDVPLEECRRRVHQRNRTQPEGLYYGDVSDALFDAVLPHIVPPTPGEGLIIVEAEHADIGPSPRGLAPSKSTSE
jgi:predicted kinase